MLTSVHLRNAARYCWHNVLSRLDKVVTVFSPKRTACHTRQHISCPAINQEDLRVMPRMSPPFYEERTGDNLPAVPFPSHKINSLSLALTLPLHHNLPMRITR